ncbi:LamG-like jellyroll fold domain-containing protein [Shimia haliotis]|uniref:Concanavalin A-like lectin/glucanases superfamily protein n=1 Tax=Shimia haliotis TaxID=1280847 RepID=A0A1I4C545_9RHOB|nr:LamG-like jellyroll fold domain-containing protein [Shimia haliotis]SFK76238.1 Concanavalin A-like lectin/glucanases superfamily protein [Shimia haliotis]
MTLMSSISKLTTSVDQLADEANVTKSQLDAKVTLAEAEVISSQGEQAATEAARDEAATHAAAAANHLATVKSDVTYRGISAILAAKAMTAVDVFVYDTSYDSDGGAWRKRCKHTSWYNEPLNTATRGARREFPAVAIIVVELPNKVTIFDADDPDLPMWMVADTRGEQNTAPYAITALGGQASYLGPVSALNGQICICGTGGYSSQALLRWDFLSDRFGNQAPNSFYSGWTSGTISERNELRTLVEGLPVILAPQVRDVAMTALSEAPVDPATWLPVPTIAVATDGGVSVIKQDGTVINPFTAYGMQCVHFSEDMLYYWQNGDHQLRRISAPNFVGNTIEFYGWRDNAIRPSISPRTTFSGIRHVVGDGKSAIAASAAADTNLALLQETRIGTGLSMVAYATSDYATGWMPGSIKGAFLADTDDTDLVGSVYLDDDFTSYADQAAAEAAGYEFSGCTFDAANDQVDFPGTGTFTFSGADPSPSGEPIIVKIVVSNRTKGNLSFQAAYSQVFAFGETGALDANGTYYFSCTSAHLRVLALNGFDGSVDSVTIYGADADRSVNNNGLIVNGNVTRSPVADGAELAAYSGFSAANYLEQPYNSALDFGTGDFCVMGWVISTDAAFDYLIYRALPNATDVGFSIAIDGANDRIGCLVKSTGFQYGSNKVLGRWTLVALIRSGGMAQVYVNGVLDFTFSAPTDVDPTTPASHIMSLGSASNGAGALNNGSIALWRISATAPTAEQIAKIYEDERKLFQPGAQCTLYGTSDAVTALAHDPKTKLLHVGTSAGRSTFDGLQRVANTETPVGTAISAVNGLIAEQ